MFGRGGHGSRLESAQGPPRFYATRCSSLRYRRRSLAGLLQLLVRRAEIGSTHAETSGYHQHPNNRREASGPASEDKASCESDAWSIPTYTDHPTEISTIIATVPDPIHSHLALDFDRSIDMILLAAADNHYLSSDYWLPWRSPDQQLLRRRIYFVRHQTHRRRQRSRTSTRPHYPSLCA